MTEEQWTAVDRYITDLFVPSDPALEAALAASEAAGLPPINVAPNQGKLLHLLARAIGARNVLEIGTLGGYSTIWLARALPRRRPPDHAGGRPEARRGRARQHRARRPASMSSSCGWGRRWTRCRGSPRERERRSTWSSSTPTSRATPDYFEWALKLTRPGSLIIVDNVVRDGAVTDAAATTPTCRACAASNGSPPSRGSAPPRSRRSAARATTASRSRSSPHLHSLPLSLKAVADWHRLRDRSYTPRAARKTGRFRTNPRHGAASVPPALETAGATRLYGSLTGAGESHASVLTSSPWGSAHPAGVCPVDRRPRADERRAARCRVANLACLPADSSPTRRRPT